MKIRFTAAPDPQAGTINLHTDIEDLFGNVRREMTVEIMRTKDNAVQQALIALGWTPPSTAADASTEASCMPTPRCNAFTIAKDFSPKPAECMNFAADLERELNEAKDRARQAEAEILTLANGDRLHPDASSNALNVQAHIDDLKRRIERLTYPTEPNQSAVETALELAAHPVNDAGRYQIGQKLLHHIQEGEDYYTAAIRILGEEVRHLRACNRVLEKRAKAQEPEPQPRRTFKPNTPRP